MPDPKLIPNEAECAGNPQLSDLRAFVLSMIGDKKQRDYNCTLQLTK